MSYTARRAAVHESLAVRDLRFHLYRWPGTDPRLLVLLHGWGDSGETFQFLVDHLPATRSVVAFDQRGFGRSERPQDGYWFPDYVADLDGVIDAISPGAPVDLVGHSMGGNVALLYAGVRPQRVRRVVSLEGFGLPTTTPDQAPARYAQWLDEVRDPSVFAVYETFDQFTMVLERRNPHTDRDLLAFVARSWGREREDGRIEVRADPKHKHVNPVLYERPQAEACWRAITAPLLMVIGDRSAHAARMAPDMKEEQLKSVFRSISFLRLANAGHMMHHEQPAATAEAIERFLSGD